MIKIFCKFFITGILCNSLLLVQLSAATTMTDRGSVTSRLEMMYKQRDSMDQSSPDYSRVVSEISALEGQRDILGKQESTLADLEKKLSTAESGTPAYDNLKKQVNEAATAKQTTLDKIQSDADKIYIQAKAATIAVAGVSNGAGDALNASLAQMPAAIAVQEEAAQLATQISDQATAKRVQAEEGARNYLAHGDGDNGPICPRSHTNPDTGVTTTTPCTPEQIASAEAMFNVPALKVEEDTAIAKKNEMIHKIQELKDQEAQLRTDSTEHMKQTALDAENKTEAGKIKTKLNSMLLGQDQKGVDNKVKLSDRFGDGKDVELTAEDKADYDNALQADITMVILGTVATRLNKCTAIPEDTKVPDMVMAASGGLAFVTGEVAEYSKLISVRNQLNTVMKDINGDPSDKQVQALESLRDSYKTIRQAVSNKIELRKTSENTFISAATMATEEAKMLAQMTSACTNSINTKVQKGVSTANKFAMLGAIGCAIWLSCAWSGCPQSEFLGVPACAVAAIAFANASSCGSGGSSSTNLNQNRQNLCEDRDPNRDPTHLHDDPSVPLGSASISVSKDVTDKCLAIKNVGSAANSACSGTIFAKDGKGPYAPCDEVDKAYERNNVTCKLDGQRHNILDGTQDPEFYKTEQKFTSIKPRKNYIEIVSDFIFSAVHAGMLSSMGISKTKVIDFLKLQTPIFANALDTQLSAPLWRSVSWVALADLIHQAIGTSTNMLDKIDADLAKIEAILDGVRKQMGLGNKGSKLDFGSSNNYQALDANVGKLPCITGSNSGNCKSLSSTLKSSPGYLDLPTATKALASQTLKVADSLNGGTLSSGTMSGISDLNASSKALRADLMKRQQSLQKILGRNGVKVDIAKEANKFGDKLKGITKAGLATSGMSAQEMRSMMGGTDGTGVKLDGPSSNIKKSSSGAGAFASGFGAGAGSAGATSSSDDDGKNSDGLTDAERAALLAAEAQANKAGSSVDAAKMGDTVNEDNGYTLFEVITNRYQKSAYPRLFKKVKE